MKACDILNETVIHNDWEQQMIMYIPRIKSFFSKTPEKMEEIMKHMEIEGTRKEADNVEDYTLQNI